jgi:hypothetical protein
MQRAGARWAKESFRYFPLFARTRGADRNRTGGTVRTSPELVYIEPKDGGPRRLLRVLGRRREGRFTVLELAPQRRRCGCRDCRHLVDVPGSFCPDHYRREAA